MKTDMLNYTLKNVWLVLKILIQISSDIYLIFTLLRLQILPTTTNIDQHMQTYINVLALYRNNTSDYVVPTAITLINNVSLEQTIV